MRPYLLLLFFAFWGCGFHAGPVRHGTDPVDTKGPDHAVHVSLTLSNNKVSSAHPVEVTVSITNLTDERILWGRGSSSCRLKFLVVGDNEEYWPHLPIMCTKDERPYYLDPRETDSQRLVWSGQVRERQWNSIWNLPPGSYDLIGVAGSHRSAPVTIWVG
jgi:hypothetical protein